VGDRESSEMSESDSGISLKGELGSLCSVVYAIVKGGQRREYCGVYNNRQRQSGVVQKVRR
jgi:hypothetical protein